jgi:hypothetical protein
VFNATVALLGKPERMVEYGMPFRPASQKPVLWLTVVGRGDVWPVEVLRIDDSDGYLYSKLTGGSTSDAVNAPVAFEFFFVAASVSCSIVWLMMIAILFPTLDETDGVLAGLRRGLPISTQIYFGESVFRPNRRARRVYLSSSRSVCSSLTQSSHGTVIYPSSEAGRRAATIGLSFDPDLSYCSGSSPSGAALQQVSEHCGLYASQPTVAGSRIGFESMARLWPW